MFSTMTVKRQRQGTRLERKKYLNLRQQQRQKSEIRIVQAIIDLKQKHGGSPSHAEIASKTGFTEGYISRMVRDLKARGVLRSHPHKRRSVDVIKLPEAISA
jgi:uncharacterized membrane protein